MKILLGIVRRGELKFRAHLRFKFRDGEIPLFHLLFVGQCFPDTLNRRVVSSFDNKWFCTHFFFPFLSGFGSSAVSFAKKSSRASSLPVQNCWYWSTQLDTSLSF